MRQNNGTTVARGVTGFNLGSGTLKLDRPGSGGGASWLTLSNASGSTAAGQSGSFTATVYNRALTPRFYYALIRVTAPGALNSPYLVPVGSPNVLANDQSANPAPSPSGLVYVIRAGSAPSTQAIRVFTSSTSPVRYQVTSTTTDRRGWLSVGGGPGNTSTDSTAEVNSVVNPANLDPGVYYGEISVSTSTDEVRTVNITAIVQPRLSTASAGRELEGCTPTAMAAVHTGLVSNFRTPAAWPVPLTVRVIDNCGEAVPNAQVVATFSNGDPALPMRLVNPNGSYSTTWAPARTGSQTTVSVRIAAPNLGTATAEITGGVSESKAPVLAPGGTLNNFSFALGMPWHRGPWSRCSAAIWPRW